jgi:hypothetical protein
MKSFGDPVCTGRTATRVRSVRHAGVLPGRPCKACVRSVRHAAPQAPVSFGPGRAPAHARERAWSRSPAQAEADQRPSPAPCRGRSSPRSLRATRRASLSYADDAAETAAACAGRRGRLSLALMGTVLVCRHTSPRPGDFLSSRIDLCSGSARGGRECSGEANQNTCRVQRLIALSCHPRFGRGIFASVRVGEAKEPFHPLFDRTTEDLARALVTVCLRRSMNDSRDAMK